MLPDVVLVRPQRLQAVARVEHVDPMELEVHERLPHAHAREGPRHPRASQGHVRPDEGEPGDIEVITDEVLRNLGLFQGTKLHRDLAFLVPERPADAIDCPVWASTTWKSPACDWDANVLKPCIEF